MFQQTKSTLLPITILALGACSARQPVVSSSQVPKVDSCSASYSITLNVDLNSKFTNGNTEIMVELRQGTVGNSKIFDTKYFVGRNASVAFSKMCPGAYFIALGNGSQVLVAPTRNFSEGQHVSSNLTVSSSGNVGARSRNSL